MGFLFEGSNLIFVDSLTENYHSERKNRFPVFSLPIFGMTELIKANQSHQKPENLIGRN
jgi:hypothetical protein